MHRTLGLAICLLNRSDVPGAILPVHPAVLCFGVLYPLPATDTRITSYDTPPMRGHTEIARRSFYLGGLEHLLSVQVSVSEYPLAPNTIAALNWEKSVWYALDAPRTARVWDQIRPLMPTQADRKRYADEHWLWTGGTSAGHPATSFGTSKHVPVVRLLWTTERSAEPIFDGQDSKVLRPRRDERKCTLWNCVNPHHFERVVPVRIGSDAGTIRDGNFARRGGLPPVTYHWTITSPAKPDPEGVFARLVLCTEGHTLGLSTQQQFNRALKGLGPASGKGYCPECYQFRRKHGQQVSRRPYKGQPITANDELQTQQWYSQTNPAPTRPRIPPDLFTEDEDPSINLHGPYDFDLFKDNDPA